MSSIDIFGVAGNSLIPNRDPGSVSGSAFIQANMNLSGSIREQNILNEFVHGNIPDFLRNFQSITVSNGSNTIIYSIMPDVLSIGSDSDYVRMPMNPHTAQAIANKYDCTLPTRKMVNDIWTQATNKLTPLPWGPPYDEDMLKTYRIGVHNDRIQAQLQGKNPHVIISGHKKDVVLTNRLYPDNHNRRVAIYGWIQPNGQAIQGLNPSSHEDTYEDYSHGIRMVANDVLVNGNPMRMSTVFSDPVLSSLVSDEGTLMFQSY
jgi:hypothetical protein